MCIDTTRRAKEPRETEITDFQHTLIVDQQIIRLQILQTKTTHSADIYLIIRHFYLQHEDSHAIPKTTSMTFQ